jgi:hypothetical protein
LVNLTDRPTDQPTTQYSGCSSRCNFTVRNLMSCNNTHCPDIHIWKTLVQLMWLVFYIFCSSSTGHIKDSEGSNKL